MAEPKAEDFLFDTAAARCATAAGCRPSFAPAAALRVRTNDGRPEGFDLLALFLFVAHVIVPQGVKEFGYRGWHFLDVDLLILPVSDEVEERPEQLGERAVIPHTFFGR